jgi:protein-glutamine gamma-glutamyltransferase
MRAALARLRHLPREARDTLFSLAVVAWTIVPHARNLPWWCMGLAALMLAWRARVALGQGSLPGRWVIVAVLALAAGLTWWSEGTLLGKEAGVTMLVVLIALKTLELRARRDAMVMFFLGFFLVLTQFLYSQSLLVALSMLVSVWGLLTALVLSHMPVGRPAFASAAAVAARAALLGLPVMAVLFVLFPRVGPLWGMPQDAAGRTGLSGSLRMGAIAELAGDESIAFRVRFEGPAPQPHQMYFRGPVLSVFNGRDWNRTILPPGARVAPTPIQLEGPALAYEMTLEPSRLALLPLLELTPDRADSAPSLPPAEWLPRLRPDLEWSTGRPVAERVRFRARARPELRFWPRALSAELMRELQLPEGVSPRTRAWALALRERPDLAQAGPELLVAAVLRHLRTGGYSYTLEPGPYTGDAIDEFWLERKLGFCEHYAASFIFVMRTLGVPARIVTGYQGSDPQPVDGWYVVRQSHAHAWAEVWLPGQGWLRVDPTAAVAPDRVQRSLSLVPAPGLVAGALGNVDPEFALRLRQAWEMLDNRWNQYVLNYSRGQQFALLKELGFAAPSWQDLGTLLALLLAAAAAGGAGWALWDRYRQDPWARLQRRVQQRLARLGVAVATHEGPRTRAARVRATLGEAGEALARSLEALDAARYAGGPPVRPARWWTQFVQAASQVQR